MSMALPHLYHRGQPIVIKRLSGWFHQGLGYSELVYEAPCMSDGVHVPFTQQMCMELSEHLDIDMNHWKRMDPGVVLSPTFWNDRRLADSVGSAASLTFQTIMYDDPNTRTWMTIDLFVSYRPSTHMLRGLLLFQGISCTALVRAYCEDVMEQVQSEFGVFGHPFSIAIALCRQVVVDIRRRLLSLLNSIDYMNMTLGYVQYPDSDAEDVGTSFGDTDLLQHTIDIQQKLVGPSNIRMAIEKQIITIKRLMQQCDIFNSMELQTPSHAIGNDTRTKLSNILGDNECLLTDADRLQTQVNALSQVLFNFMNIKESRANTELARSSKVIAEATMRDSSAMKSIAVLTMIFLPATAVAPVLGTPFFEYETSRGVVARDIGTFLAISLALTFAVFMIWIAAVKLDWSKWLEKIRHRGAPKHGERSRKGRRNWLDAVEQLAQF